uniref:Uncharacterized protein n=1 Tax=Setaria viridis TaxID=4556 RepID=A0A4U6W4S4_SETVI|nr:hypothetical protein SEVIR_1G052701v2 [Setaria viridis]
MRMRCRAWADPTPFLACCLLSLDRGHGRCNASRCPQGRRQPRRRGGNHSNPRAPARRGAPVCSGGGLLATARVDGERNTDQGVDGTVDSKEAGSLHELLHRDSCLPLFQPKMAKDETRGLPNCPPPASTVRVSQRLTQRPLGSCSAPSSAPTASSFPWPPRRPCRRPSPDSLPRRALRASSRSASRGTRSRPRRPRHPLATRPARRAPASSSSSRRRAPAAPRPGARRWRAPPARPCRRSTAGARASPPGARSTSAPAGAARRRQAREAARRSRARRSCTRRRTATRRRCC